MASYAVPEGGTGCFFVPAERPVVPVLERSKVGLVLVVCWMAKAPPAAVHVVVPVHITFMLSALAWMAQSTVKEMPSPKIIRMVIPLLELHRLVSEAPHRLLAHCAPKSVDIED